MSACFCFGENKGIKYKAVGILNLKYEFVVKCAALLKCNELLQNKSCSFVELNSQLK